MGSISFGCSELADNELKELNDNLFRGLTKLTRLWVKIYQLFYKTSSKPTTCFFKYKISLYYRTIEVCLLKRSGMKFFQNIKVAEVLFLLSVLILAEIKVNKLPAFTDTQS